MKRPRLAWAFLPGGISCPPLPRCAGIRQSLSWLAGSHTILDKASTANAFLKTWV